MNSSAIRKLTQGSALYVVAHGFRQRQRGRKPSATYGDCRRPSEAYAKALADLNDQWGLPEADTRRAILSTLNGEVQSPLAGLEGIYVGFSPTDESAIGMGEMQLTITPFSFEIKMATGLKIEDNTLVTGLLPITEATQMQIRSLLSGDIPESATLRMFNMDGEPWLLLIRDTQEPNTDCLRLILGEMAEILGPTILFTPERVKAGDLEEAISDIELDYGEMGVIPRISTAGRAPREYRQEAA
ncbi:hypothetical protein KBC70_01075 [Candidatus Woesebacteria bacterium]|nr:hypothetical protein [Candidatus Woesebacteria bacterium]